MATEDKPRKGLTVDWYLWMGKNLFKGGMNKKWQNNKPRKALKVD